MRFIRDLKINLNCASILSRLSVLSALTAASLAFAACTELAEPTSTPVPFEPTAAVAGTRALVLTGGSEIDIAALSQPRELPEGDSARGDTLYNTLGCTACHGLGEDAVVGPGFKGVYARAATRTELSADEYIVQSITKPSAYIVEGYTNSMQVFDYLTDQELADLIAFMKTVE